MTRGVFLTLLLTTAATAQDPAPITFTTQTKLVLLPFHVRQGNKIAPDLKAGDVTLIEDGKPRPFTIFDSPATAERLPLELVLLFDVNPRIEFFWDPADVFRFIPQWEEGLTRQLLEKQDTDVRISVYATAGQKLYRMTGATKRCARRDAQLSRPPQRELPERSGRQYFPHSSGRERHRGLRPIHGQLPNQLFLSNEHRGWPMEAAIGVLNDVAAPQDRVSRVMVMFSEGIGATTTLPQDIGTQALDLGIPIYPVATNYKHHIDGGFPRNRWRMDQFKNLAKLTGGQSVELATIDAPLLLKILNSFEADALAQYVIGFEPDSNASPKRHNLEVRVAKKSTGTIEGGKRRAVY
jgi:hypothetical protein